MRIGHRAGANTAIDQLELASKNQFALELDHFAHDVAPWL
jgi:hypothetical protein